MRGDRRGCHNGRPYQDRIRNVRLTLPMACTTDPKPSPTRMLTPIQRGISWGSRNSAPWPVLQGQLDLFVLRTMGPNSIWVGNFTMFYLCSNMYVTYVIAARIELSSILTSTAPCLPRCGGRQGWPRLSQDRTGHGFGLKLIVSKCCHVTRLVATCALSLRYLELSGELEQPPPERAIGFSSQVKHLPEPVFLFQK